LQLSHSQFWQVQFSQVQVLPSAPHLLQVQAW